MTGPSVSCEARAEVLRLLRLREEDILSPEEEGRLKAHLPACPACREEALRLDPTLLFLPLSLSRSCSPAPARAAAPGVSTGDDEGRRLAAQVRASLDLDRARRRISPRAGLASWGIGRVAKIAAAAAFVGVALVVASSLRTVAPAAGAGGGAGSPGVSTASLVPGARNEGPGEVPPIEAVASPGAKVYQFAPASRYEPTVVFVVDRDADI